MNSSEIIWNTHAIIREVQEKFPEYREILSRVPVRVTNRATRRLGAVRFRGEVPIELVMSFKVFQHEANSVQLRDTVLHEIAHVIAGIKAGHRAAWKAVAIKIGAKPEAKCKDLPVSAVQYVEVSCFVCSQPLKVSRHRAARVRNGGRRYRHSTCKPQSPPLNFLLTYR